MNAVVKSPSERPDIRQRHAPAPVAVLRPANFTELRDFATVAARSGMVPQAYQNKPDAVIIAVQMGSELGLSPMQSLSNIAVVNGRPSVWGDAMPGLCRQSPVCDDIEEWFDGEGETLTAHCKATRVGKRPVVQQFSVADAKKAGLWGKTGPWTNYPRRMLQMRARGFALRDAFPDVLRGLISYEEAQDIPPETFHGTTIDAPRPYTSAGTIIGDEIPKEHPKPRTRRMFLDDLHATLGACHTEDEVDAICQSDEVAKAVSSFTNGSLAELNGLINEALDRVRKVDDDFPGDAE